MSKRYPGNFITGNPVALSQTSNNGIWDVTDVSAAVAAGTWQEPDGIYEIPRSLRIRNSSPAYLTRTPATAGNRRIWTRSFWVKRGASGDGTSGFHYFTYHAGAASQEVLDFYTNSIRVYFSGGTYLLETTQKFRDYSAWYHIVVAVDTTQASAANRVKLYVNGSQITTWTTFTTVPQNFDCNTNNTVAHGIGYNGGSNYFDGYMAEMYLIDGQQLDPSYFGYFDPITNIWQPKKYTGGYGTNGFYLPFSENGSTAQLGKNFGNGSNYITYSEQFNNANWLKPAAPVAPTISTDATTAPDGTTTADAVVFSGSTTHPCYQEYTVSVPNGQSWTASMYVKQATGTSFALQCTIFGSSGVVQDGYNNFNFDSATNSIRISSTESNSFMKVGSEYIGNGWHRVWATNTNVSGSSGTYIRMSIGQRSAPTAWSIYCWGAQLTLGNTVLPYTATTASAISYDWTPSGISVTAGATYDSMVDSPTNVFTTATDVGGVVPGNYCTLNPLSKLNWLSQNDTVTPSNSNLQFAVGVGGAMMDGTIAVSSGKWYWEQTQTAYQMNGIRSTSGIPTGDLTYRYYQGNGQIQYVPANSTSATILTTVATSTSGDIIGIALDLDNRTISWYKNNTLLYTATNIVVDTYAPCVGAAATTSGGVINFGQRPFAYAPPAGFKSLNTTNIQALGTSAVGSAAIQANKWFDTVLYGGTGVAKTITNPGGFVPDLVWAKVRNTTYSHNWSDSARGAGVRLSSDTTAVEGANPNGGVTSFNTTNNNGYNIDGGVEVNENGRPYVSWQWKASPTSGLNIVTYTGTGVARSISHNLGVAPSFMIVKQRDVAVRSWAVYHAGLSNPQQAFYLDSTAAPFAYTAFFNNTAPTSSNFSLGTDATVNQSGSNYIAYIWAEVPGFSKFGNYVGNGSADGSFVYTGFRPRFIIFKRTDTTGSWFMEDSSRGTYNVMGPELYSNQTDVEAISNRLDFVSNGFKMRAGNSGDNASGGTYIYIAFAESPFALNNRAR